jgi:hypothetical protein
MPPLAAAIIIAYPTCDDAANFVDAQRDGDLEYNQPGAQRRG